MDNIDISFGNDILIGQEPGINIDEQNNVEAVSDIVAIPGEKGEPGFSPIANVRQTANGAIISITDEQGTTTATVTNGQPGVSPSASVTQTASGAVIEITDANGTTTANVSDGEPGSDGQNATITIGSVTSLSYGSTPTVTNTGTPTNAVLNWGIPEGQRGEQGIQGEPGINAQAYVTQNTGSATITIEDADGTTTATVYDGQNGTNGQDGFSPSASVTQTASGATISITDSQGTTTANITNGVDGTDGTDGVTPSITATASVDNTTGTPAVSVTKSGTDANPSFAFAFEHLKGETGTLSPVTVSISDFITPSSGITITGNVYQFGKLIVCHLVVASNTAFSSSAINIGVLKPAYAPKNYINEYCAIGSTEWRIQGIAYMYVDANNFQITDYNNTSRTYAKVMLTYVIN